MPILVRPILLFDLGKCHYKGQGILCTAIRGTVHWLLVGSGYCVHIGSQFMLSKTSLYICDAFLESECQDQGHPHIQISTPVYVQGHIHYKHADYDFKHTKIISLILSMPTKFHCNLFKTVDHTCKSFHKLFLRQTIKPTTL